MGRRSKHRESTSSMEEAMINLMPLIDVVFVVLIMFIVIAPMLDVDQVNLATGVTEVKESELKEGICIHVQADNSILVNKQAVPLKNLKTLLIEQKKKHPIAKPQLYQDKDATFGTYQEVKSSLREAGFEQMDVILNPKT